MWMPWDPQKRIISKLQKIVTDIDRLEPTFESFTVAQIQERTAQLRKRVAEGESLDALLPEAFALVREAGKKTLRMRHYGVQLMGGIALHQGKIAEMKTGEGKTLVATAPVYLNALTGKGVHIVTVNDYLAKRDAVWMGQIYHALGMSVGCIVHDQAFVYDPAYTSDAEDKERDETGSFKIVYEFLKPVARKEAYAADITFGTNNEFGFDYLRDNLVMGAVDCSQRGHHFAVVDEVDSILIDEARTPLIISMPDEDSGKLYAQFAQIIPHLVENTHYNIDEKLRAVALTEEGIAKVEQVLGVDNIYDTTIFGGSGIRYVHHLEQALRAQALFHRDKDYIVKDGEVIIVDEFTGRLMPGRRYSEGLHQSIEAKEGVPVQKESRTLASITFQNYFRMYEKLSGMTGTAATSAEEFSKVYTLDVIEIPPNKPNKREDIQDMIYKTAKGRFQAVVAEIAARHKTGQPVLVGTVSIEKNEYLSALLKREGVPHQVLNAKNHEQEAEIIAQAGKRGAVTVATNMAGRGVDIILGGNPADDAEAQAVRELGGLYVIGTERHEARRIDNQLRGRAGRQGDPGASVFFVSMEDDLMRIFGSEKIKKMMDTLGVPEDQPIQNMIVSKSIESAQSKIEGFHFDSRKHVLEYDEVMNKHREAVYKMRRDMLTADDVKSKVIDIVRAETDVIVDAHTHDDFAQNWNIREIEEDLDVIIPLSSEDKAALVAIQNEEVSPADKRTKLKNLIGSFTEATYAQKEKEYSEEMMRQVERLIVLRNIDTLWMDHLENMEHLQDSVRLRAYGQQDPLIEYKNEGHRMFKEMLAAIDRNVTTTIFKIGPPRQQSQEARPVVVSAVPNADKIGRNDLCPCGSGKKYKKCHGK